MEIFDNLLMTLALGGLAVSGLLFASALIYPYLRSAWRQATILARAVFCGAVVVACLFGGAKGKISYPKTDTDVAYLTDAGSYVTNDAVHVAFTRVPTVPDTATFYLDYCALDGTNSAGVATNWVNAKSATFADLTVPFDFAFAAATNYNWMAYTDWTPGPAVQTNGVWHAYWGIDKKEGRYFIPVRTCVRDGGSVIATPKSKWDAKTSPNAYVQDGLVAMWDGEWNAGRGVHDDAATTWKDLIGGHVLAGRFTPLAKSIYFDGIDDYSKCNTLLKAETTGKFTIEVSFKSHGSGKLTYSVPFATHYGSEQRLQVNCEVTFRAHICYNGVQTLNFYGDPEGTVTYSFDGEKTMAISLNGEYRGSLVWQNSYKHNILNIGYFDYEHSYRGEVYNVRYYQDRALTQDEIAHNYAVDKARFGSGNE